MTPQEYAERLYPLADPDDYPENPDVNKANKSCRYAFMNGFNFAIQQSIPYQALHLRRSGDYVVVEIEVGHNWVEIIREYAADNAPFGHIIEPAGIYNAIKNSAL